MIDIYLASPYSHQDSAIREQRYEQACETAAALMRQGKTVFCPIAHSHNLVKYGLPTDWGYWERTDAEMIAHCKTLVVLTIPGWEESEGVQAEERIAIEQGKQVGYVTLRSESQEAMVIRGYPEKIEVGI